MSLALVALMLAGAFAGCSSSEDTAEQPRSATERDESPAPQEERPDRKPRPACPSEAQAIVVRDLLGRAKDRYEILEPAEKPPAITALEAALAGRLREVDVRILAPPGQRLGTVVAVVNATEAIDLEDLVEGAIANEGIQLGRRTIAGKPGLIIAPTGGGNIALAPVARCAALVLTDSDRSSLLAVADVLAAP